MSAGLTVDLSCDDPASLGINSSVSKELGGVRTPLQLGRRPFAGLAAPTEPAGQVSPGAADRDMPGIAPRGHSPTIQDAFQCVTSPESN